VATGNLLRTIGGLETGDGSAAQRTAFDAAGARVAIATMATSSAAVFDVHTGQRVGELVPADPARDTWGWSEVAWSPDGELLAAAQASLVRIYDGASLRLLYVLTDHTAWITKLDWSADGSRLLTASGDGSARLWNIDRERVMSILTLVGHDSGVIGASLSPDGSRALTADPEGTVRIWETGVTGDAEWLNLPAEEVWLSSVIFGPGGRTILGSVPGGRTAIWNAETGEELLTLAAHDPIPGYGGVPGVAAISASPDGELVATGGRDKTVRVWSSDNGEQLECCTLGIGWKMSGSAPTADSSQSPRDSRRGSSTSLRGTRWPRCPTTATSSRRSSPRTVADW
jgi:WD40 repeat protein